MARMLTLLEARGGHRVLEIGTGTGYNAALLCHRLGSANIASLDIDPELIDAARQRLATLGFHPALTVGDEAAGYAEHAPYDRITATCAVRVIPPAWVTQLRPGGLIVADLRGELASSLLVARDHGDGAVHGRFLTESGHFMWLRAHADNPLRDGGRLTTHIDYEDARTTTTQIDPAILDQPGFRFLLQFTIPGIGPIWTAIRHGRTLIRLRGDAAHGPNSTPPPAPSSRAVPLTSSTTSSTPLTNGTTSTTPTKQARHHHRAPRPHPLARHTNTHHHQQLVRLSVVRNPTWLVTLQTDGAHQQGADPAPQVCDVIDLLMRGDRPGRVAVCPVAAAASRSMALTEPQPSIARSNKACPAS
jgi:protein-L-isoaspartate O-methyltransferase